MVAVAVTVAVAVATMTEVAVTVAVVAITAMVEFGSAGGNVGDNVPYRGIVRRKELCGIRQYN